MKKLFPIISIIILLTGCAIFRTDPISQPSVKAPPGKKKIIRKITPLATFENSKIDIIAGPGKYEVNCVFWTPAMYDNTKAYPLVIFAHGMGEAGGNINTLYNTGLPAVLKSGYKPSFDFIMIAPQGSSYSADPKWFTAILEEAKKKYLIDESRIYLTGLSAGGWFAYGSVLNLDTETAKKIAAIVPLSAATQDLNKTHFDWFNISQTHVWAVVGGQDPSYRDQNVFVVANIPPSLATITIRPGVGHTGWNDVYSGLIKNNGLTMWEWLYQYRKVGSPPIPGPGNLVNDTFKVLRFDTLLILQRFKS